VDLLAATAGSDWVSCEAAVGADDGSAAQAETSRRKRDAILLEVLLCENLIVLAGLGTTRYIRNADGKALGPTMADLWTAAKARFASTFDGVRQRVKHPESDESIEVLLSHCQLSEILQPDAGVAAFIRDTEALIVEKCQFVNDSISLEIHEMFLRKVARRSTRQPRLRLFTTNYDVCFETAASHTRFVVVDGFSHTQPQEFDGSYFGYDLVRRDQNGEAPDYISNVFHLYKIHGSIDWELQGTRVVRVRKPERPLLIYPRHSKFESSYDQPFIEMMSRFQVALRQPNTAVLVIGLGFNDPHIYQPLMSAVRSNVGLRLVVVDPDAAKKVKPALAELVSLIKGGDHRLALLNGSFEAFVPVLPDLVAVTEEERHLRRVESARAQA